MHIVRRALWYKANKIAHKQQKQNCTSVNRLHIGCVVTQKRNTINCMLGFRKHITAWFQLNARACGLNWLAHKFMDSRYSYAARWRHDWKTHISITTTVARSYAFRRRALMSIQYVRKTHKNHHEQLKTSHNHNTNPIVRYASLAGLRIGSNLLCVCAVRGNKKTGVCGSPLRWWIGCAPLLRLRTFDSNGLWRVCDDYITHLTSRTGFLCMCACECVLLCDFLCRTLRNSDHYW